MEGYSSDRKAYRIYDLTPRRVVESHNVCFVETLGVQLPPPCYDLNDEKMNSDIDSRGGNNATFNGII